MKIIKVYTLLISLLLLVSCDSEKPQKTKAVEKEIVVKTLPLKQVMYKDVKSYFGTLKFSKSTNFVAQQSGIITKLNAVPGQEVKQGELIAIYPPTNHHLQIEQAKIQQQKTQQDYNRQKELFAVGAVTAASLEDYKAQLDLETKTLEQLERVNTITAPFHGVITQVHANVGQEISMDMPIFSMAQAGQLEVDFYVTPKDILDIRLDASVFFDKGDEKIKGTITKKSLQLDERRRAYLVTASFQNNAVVYVGDTIDIMVETGTAVECIWIPIEAFRKQGNSYYVFVLEGDKAIQKRITIGKRNEQQVQVIKGLKEGDQLITAGIDKLKDNVLVQVAL